MQMNFSRPEEEDVNSTFVSGRRGISAGAMLGNSIPPARILPCCFSWERWADVPSPASWAAQQCHATLLTAVRSHGCADR